MSGGSCGVSLVVTVRDEAGAIDELCASIAAQTWPPDEVVVVDGGSADDTVARLGRWRDRLPLRVLTVPGSNISQGRNAGVAAARHELVAVTDAGVRLAPGWLAALVAPLRLDGGYGPLPSGGGEARPAGEYAGRAAAPPGPPDPGGEDDRGARWRAPVAPPGS